MALSIEFRRLRIFRRLRELEEQMGTLDKRLRRLELRAMEEDCRRAAKPLDTLRQSRQSDETVDTESGRAEPEKDDRTQHTQRELKEWLLFQDEYPKEGDV